MKMTAKFHLPGLRYNYPLNMMLLSLKEDSVTGISVTDALWKKW